MPRKKMSDEAAESMKRAVMRDIKGGMSMDEIIKKHPGVSLYYVKKWSNEAFKPMDLDTLVRTRFRHQVNDTVAVIQERMSDSVPYLEVMDISDSTWSEWAGIIKAGMYDLCKEVIKRK